MRPCPPMCRGSGKSVAGSSSFVNLFVSVAFNLVGQFEKTRGGNLRLMTSRLTTGRDRWLVCRTALLSSQPR